MSENYKGADPLFGAYAVAQSCALTKNAALTQARQAPNPPHTFRIYS
jgi:hypothetical protein